jgi:hypothetical protein
VATDNITSIIKLQPSQATSVTLDSVRAALDAWRGTKKIRSEKIPASLWDQIFILFRTEPDYKTLTALSITRMQYDQQRKRRKSVNKADDPIEFCETQAATSAIPLAYTPAKAFSTTTSVVEIRRPDGMLMKIHLCTDRFEELLGAFFKG